MGDESRKRDRASPLGVNHSAKAPERGGDLEDQCEHGRGAGIKERLLCPGKLLSPTSPIILDEVLQTRLRPPQKRPEKLRCG